MQQASSKDKDFGDLENQFERMALTLLKKHESILQKKYDDAYDQLFSILQPLQQLLQQLPKEKREILENELVLFDMLGTRANRRMRNTINRKKRSTTKSIETKTGRQNSQITYQIQNNYQINNYQINNHYINSNEINSNQINNIQILKDQRSLHRPKDEQLEKRVSQIEQTPTCKYELFENQDDLGEASLYHKAFGFNVKYFLEYCCLNEQTKESAETTQIIQTFKSWISGILSIIAAPYCIAVQVGNLILQMIGFELGIKWREIDKKKVALQFINLLQMSNKMNYIQVLQLVSFERARKIKFCKDSFKMEKENEVEELVKFQEKCWEEVKNKQAVIKNKQAVIENKQAEELQDKFWDNKFWKKGLNDSFIFLIKLQEQGRKLQEQGGKLQEQGGIKQYNLDLGKLAQSILDQIDIS